MKCVSFALSIYSQIILDFQFRQRKIRIFEMMLIAIVLIIMTMEARRNITFLIHTNNKLTCVDKISHQMMTLIKQMHTIFQNL